MELDPALKQILRYPAAELAQKPLPVIARLVDADVPVPGFVPVARFGNVVTGRTRLEEIVRTRRHHNVLSFKASRRVHGALNHSVPEAMGALSSTQHDSPLELSETGRGVVLGLLDWGCDITHSNFRNADGTTRLSFLWDQRGGESGGPAPFDYGQEHSRQAINAALRTSNPFVALGYPLSNSDDEGGTHGTHVMDIAAGNGRAPGSARGMASEAELIFVHLKASDISKEQNLGDSVRLLEGIRYVLDKANQKPVVLNVSMGQHGGPHDGTTLFEQALDFALTEKPGRAVVMSTGNYFSAEVHASHCVRPSEAIDLKWDLPAPLAEACELEVWYSGASELRAELIAPDGARTATVALGGEVHAEGPFGLVASMHHRAHDPNNGDHHLDVFLHPAATHGVWTLRLVGVRGLGLFHAWLERTAAGAQPKFLPHLSTRVTTTNTICNGRQTITVGAHTAVMGQPVLLPFSSSGPTRDGRMKPLLLAPGGGIRAARSARWLHGAWTRDELTVKSGTSMAAPHVSGAVALMFEAAGGSRLSAGEVVDILGSTALPVAPTNPFDGLRCGAGLLNARAAVFEVRRRLRHESTNKVTPGQETQMLEVENGSQRHAVVPGDFGLESAEVATYTRKSATDPSLNTATIVAVLREVNRQGRWGPVVTDHPRLWDVIHGTTTRSRDPRVRALAQERFLPWHRWYLYRFEQEMRAVARGMTNVRLADVFIPYWNWSQGGIPSWVPEIEPVLHAAGQNQPLNVDRPATRGGPLPTAQEVRRILVPARYPEFSQNLESVHNDVHVHVSGTMGGMSSPADFLFFMHHCEIDRIWWTWQRRIDLALRVIPNAALFRPMFRATLTGSDAVVGTRTVNGSTVNVTATEVEDVTTGALGFDYDAQFT